MKRVSLFLPAMLLALCATLAEAVSPLTWVGCGITRKAFMAEMAAAWEMQTGQKIEIQGGGATKGIRDTVAGKADMGGSCRYKLDVPEESAAAMRPVAWDALVVIVHPDNPVSGISLDQLGRLYLGEITNWTQLGGPDHALELYVREGKISGVGRTIRELVFADPEMEFPNTHTFASSGPLEEALEANPWAIAMTGISSARKRNLKILTLDGKTPDFESIKSGDYLLYRPLYIALNLTNPRKNEIDEFLDFIHSSQGMQIIRNNGVVPYLEAVHLTRKQRQQWQRSRELGREGD